MRQLIADLYKLPRRDKWLLAFLFCIIIGIILITLYGIRQAEIAEQRELEFKQHTEITAEQNRLELERQAAESAAQIEALKRQAAEVNERQTRNELKNARSVLLSTNRARLQEQKEYEAKIKGIITANVKACEKWLSNCARAKRLGLRDPDAPCICR